MANTQKGSLFSRLTKLFRSGPIVRRRVRDFRQQGGSTALDVFRKAHSDVYNSTLSAYGAFDRMCVDLETKIPVPGPEKFMTLNEMIEKYPNDEKFIVYSFDHEKKEIVPAWAHHPRSSGIKDTIKVTFDDGTTIICTPDHPCMLRDGTYKDAGELQQGDSMMPFYRKDFSGNKKEGGKFSGYENVYTMTKNGGHRGWKPEHRLIAEWANKKENYNDVVHHKDFNSKNNNPDNLVFMSTKDHQDYHAKLAHCHTDEMKKYFSDIQKAAWVNNDERRKNLIEFNQRADIKEKRRQHAIKNNPTKNPDVVKKISEKSIERYKNSDERTKQSRATKKAWEEGKIIKSEKFTKFWDGKTRPEEWKEKRRGANNSSFIDLSEEDLRDAILKVKQRKLVAEILGASQSSVIRRAKNIFCADSWEDIVDKVVNESKSNHKVVSVAPYKKLHVGDLTVDGYENFATDTIVVHNSRYSDFSEMEATPEICSSLDIYAEESVSSDDKGKVLHIYSENKKIQDILEELFYDILNVDFNLSMWVRNLVKYGDFFIFNDISPEFGIINAYPIPISEIEREEGFDPNDPAAVRFRWITQGNQTLENWQVTHFRLLGNDAFLPYGSSVLESARRIWRQLIMMEDAMLVYRVIRAPERRVFYIDVGNTPPEEVANYMESAQTSLKRNQVIDKITGKTDLRYNPLSVDEDYFLPVRGGVTGTKIDTLAGGQNTAAIEDVQYIQKKLFAALKIPKAYLGYDEDVGSKATLAQEDIRFSRAINRIQKTIISSLNQLAQIHLFCHGFEGEDLQDFSLFLTNPSSVAQEQKLNLIKTKFEIAGAAPEGVVDRRWIRKNVMGLTNDDIDLIKSGRIEDKEEDADLEASGQDDGMGGGGGGGSLGGGGGFDMGSDDTGEELDAGEEDVGADDAPESDEEGAEDLFAGDKKTGDLLTASKKKKKKQKTEKQDLEELDLSIDDESAPEKAEKKMLNVFGGPITPNRKVRNGSNDLQSPNFTSMVSIGSNTRSQDTSNKPFDNDFFSFNEEKSYGDSYVQPKFSRDLKNMISSLGKSINRNRKSLISEDLDKDFQ